MNLLLLITFLFFTSDLHDIQVAYFTFHQVDNQLLLDINFEKEDLLSTLDLNEEELTNERLFTYLQEHFEVKLNDTQTPFRLKKVIAENNHLDIVCLVGANPSNLNTITIENTCFLEIEGHSNIIEFRLENQERGFLSNKDRTSIIINFWLKNSNYIDEFTN